MSAEEHYSDITSDIRHLLDLGLIELSEKGDTPIDNTYRLTEKGVALGEAMHCAAVQGKKARLN